MWYTPNRAEKKAAEAGYTINLEGTEVHKPDGKLASLSLTKEGYPRFSMRADLGRHAVRLHRLQAWFKYGEAMYEPGILCRHKDGNPGNNHRDNIILGTQADNMQDRPPEARRAHAWATSRHAMKHDHVAILAHYRQFGWLSTLAHFNVGRGTLSYIINKSQTGTPITPEERPKAALAKRAGRV